MEEKSGGEPTDHPLDLTHYLQPNVANPSSEQVPAPGPNSQPPQVSAPQAPDALQENIFASLPQPDEGFQPFLSRQHEAAGPSGEPVPQQPEPRGSQVRQRKSSSRARAAAQRTWRDSSMEPEPRKRARGAQGDGSQAVARHIVTEQQRRDREKAGFAALRELVPMEEKLDKATFLKRVCSYISNLQDVMQQLLERGALNSLPTDTQWNVRMLLPRRPQPFPLPSSAAGTASAQVQGPPATGSLALPQMGLQVPGMLDPSQMASLGLASAAAVPSLAFLSGASLLPLLQPVQAPITANALAVVQAMMTHQVLQAVLAGTVGQAQGQAALLPAVAPNTLQPVLPNPLLPLQPGLPGTVAGLGGASLLGNRGGVMASPQRPHLPSAAAPQGHSSEMDSGQKDSEESSDNSQGSRPVKTGSKVRRQTAATIAPPDYPQSPCNLVGRPGSSDG